MPVWSWTPNWKKGLKSMNRRKFIKHIGTTAALGTLGTLPAMSLANKKKISLTILHTNDVHSRIEPFPMDGSRFQGLGGVARRSTLIRKIREQENNVLLLDAGDMFQGTPYFNLFGGKLELQLMSRLGYDAGTFGNHEFDNGLEGLLKHLHHANFPFLIANYDFTDTVLEGKTEKYRIFNKQGLRIGVFGLGIDIDGLVDPKNHEGMKYLDPIATANETTSLLKEKYKCHMIICLSHLGYKYNNDKISDCLLAGQTKDIDLIIGGHTHTFLDAPVPIENLSKGSTLVTQTGFGGINLGRIDFRFDTQSRKLNYRSYTYTIDHILEDDSRITSNLIQIDKNQV